MRHPDPITCAHPENAAGTPPATTWALRTVVHRPPDADPPHCSAPELVPRLACDCGRAPDGADTSGERVDGAPTAADLWLAAVCDDDRDDGAPCDGRDATGLLGGACPLHLCLQPLDCVCVSEAP